MHTTASARLRVNVTNGNITDSNTLILTRALILTVVAVVGRRVGVRDDEVAKIHRIPSTPHRDPLQILHLYTHLTVEDTQSYHTHLDVVGQAEGDLHVRGRA